MKYRNGTETWSVKTTNAEETMITLTENAAKEIQKIMLENELTEDVCVRIGVKGGGLSLIHI